MALPALRLQGLYLALATMAFAEMAILFFPQPEILGTNGRKLSTPAFFLGIDFDDPANFVVFAAVGVRGAGTLRRVVAARPLRSPAARAARQPGGERDHRREPGVTKLLVFSLAAAMAGFAGGLLGTFHGTAAARTSRCSSGSRTCCSSWSAGSAR